MKLAKRKGSNRALEAGFCCFWLKPDETRQDQRQQMCLKNQDFAASGLNAMFLTRGGVQKPIKLKGNHITCGAEFELPLKKTGDND